MYAFFDKYGKKILAVVSVLLMIAFLWNPYQRAQQGHAGGKLNGSAIDVNAYNFDVASLENLNQIRVPAMRGVPIEQASYSIGQAMLGGAFEKFHQNPLNWHLLVNETRSAGIYPSDTDVNGICRSVYRMFISAQHRDYAPFDKLKPEVQDDIRNNVRVLLAVMQNYQRSQQTIKVSQPLIKDQIATFTHKVRARVSLVDAAPFEGAVDADLQSQFAAFASVAEGSVDAKNNPYGFGYLVPNLVKLQYFKVPAKEIETLVNNSKKPEMWEEDARMYYAKNKQNYAETPKDESTTQPSTQPVATVIPEFEKISDKVYADMRKPLYEARRKAVVTAITTRLNADYQKVSKSYTATTQEVVDSKVGNAGFASDEYLRTIQTDVSKQFNINIELVIDARMVSQDQLEADAVFGHALSEETKNQSAAEYIFGAMKQFAAKTNDKSAVTLSDVYQPLKPLISPEGTIVARVAQAEAAHALADFSSIKDRVERDVRRKKGLDQAVTKAEGILAKARESGLGSVSDLKIYSTEFLNVRSTEIKEIPDSQSYARQLITEIFNLQRLAKDESSLPVRSIVKLPQANKVAVVELFAVDTDLDSDTAKFIDALAVNATSDQLKMLGTPQPDPFTRQQPLPLQMEQWFDMEAVSKRVGYVEPKVEGETPKAPKQAAPGNPFQP